jgi:hypothetical protein
MHLHVSDVFPLVAILMVTFLFPLIESIYPLWVEAVIVVSKLRKQHVKPVSKAYDTKQQKR